MALSFAAQLEPWLSPIASDQPAGTPQPELAAYVGLKQEIDQLNALSGGVPKWPIVLQNGREVLRVWKDIPVAAQAAHAALECEGLAGFAGGLALLAGILDRFWEHAHPTRLRARTNAVTWLIERASTRLESVTPRGDEGQAIAVVREATQELTRVVRARWDDNLPALSPLEQAVARLELNLPPSASHSSPSQVTPAVVAMPTPEAVATIQPQATPPTAEPTPTHAAAETSDQDTVRAQVVASIATFVAPLAPLPVGEDPHFSPEAEALRAELAKRDNPAAGVCDWKVVERLAHTVLTQRGKDLRIAAYLAQALLENHGLLGFYRGMAIIIELCQRYWGGFFPGPRRGSMAVRRTPMLWLIDLAPARLENQQVTYDDTATVTSLRAYLRESIPLVNDLFADDAPSLRPLSDAVERLYLSLPPPPASTAAPQPTPVAVATPTPTPAPTPLVQASAAFASDLPKPSTTAESPQEVAAFLVTTGQSLVKVAGLLRQANVGDPLAYRLHRQGLWLHVTSVPSADAAGKTTLRSIQDRRASFDVMARNGKWEALLDETESALAQHRFCLDLNYYVSQALQAMGDTGAPAMQAVAGEVAALLRRLPTLMELRANDNTPLATDETRAWLEQDVLGTKGKASPQAGQLQDDWQSELGDANKLDVKDLVERALPLLAQSRDPRQRALRQLDLADLLANREPALALHLAAVVDDDLRNHRLDTWDREVAVRTYESLVLLQRKLNAARGGSNRSDGAAQEQDWLCRLARWDLQAAARLAR